MRLLMMRWWRRMSHWSFTIAIPSIGISWRRRSARRWRLKLTVHPSNERFVFVNKLFNRVPRKGERKKNSIEETHRAVSSSALLHDALERPPQQQQQRQKVKVLILNENIIPPPRTVAQQTLTHLISHSQTKTALWRWFNKEMMNNVRTLDSDCQPWDRRVD